MLVKYLNLIIMKGKFEMRSKIPDVKRKLENKGIWIKI